MNVPASNPWLTPRDITEQYLISKATLSEWRAKRVGPSFRQLGRAIHYRRSDMEDFIASKMVRTG